MTGTGTLLSQLFQTSRDRERAMAVLIDPDKFSFKEASNFLSGLPKMITHLFVGGSTVEKGETCKTVRILKALSDLPVILFPGDHSQVSQFADGILFLSLISGRNPEFLIEQQVRSVSKLKHMQLEIIPTGYILIDGKSDSAVARVSDTQPISQTDVEMVVDTALAGQYSGKKLIYLEAGSGAKIPISEEIISAVKEAVSIPVIVGGGIRSSEELEKAYRAGADMVVVGTAFENGSFR